MSLTAAYQALKTANEKYDRLLQERTAEKTPDVRALRKDCSKAVVSLWNAIDFYAEEYPDLDYSTIIGELNTFNGEVQRQLKARASRRKNGAKTETEKPIEMTPAPQA